MLIAILLTVKLWKADYNNDFEWYDSIGIFSTLKLAYRILNIPQAVTLKGSYVSNILFADQPFHAKANLKGGFYNSYGYRYFHSRRGNRKDESALLNLVFQKIRAENQSTSL
jgi:hypothetical protein